LYGYIRGWGPGRKKALIITLVLMIGVPFGDVLPGKLYLAYVCHREGGIAINESVDVAGYSVGDDYSHGCGSLCVEALVKWHALGKPMFIESKVTGRRDYIFGEGPSLYRFQLVSRNDEVCKKQDDIKLNYPAAYNNYRIPDGYCVEAKKIDKSMSSHLLINGKWERNYSRLFGIARVRTRVAELNTGRVLGENTGFTHKGGWLRRWIAGALAVGQPDECIDQGDYGFTWSVLRGVFNH
jgi:hypothetical protein